MLAVVDTVLLVAGIVTAVVGVGHPSDLAVVRAAIRRTEARRTFDVSFTLTFGGQAATLVGAADVAHHWTTLTVSGRPPGFASDVFVPDAYYHPSPLDPHRYVQQPAAPSENISDELDTISRAVTGARFAGHRTDQSQSMRAYTLAINPTVFGDGPISGNSLDIDVDGHGLVRHIEGGSPGTTLVPPDHLSVDLWRFGVAVPDPRPAAALVDDAADVSRRLAQLKPQLQQRLFHCAAKFRVEAAHAQQAPS